MYVLMYSTKASMYVYVHIRIKGQEFTQQRLACICKYKSVCKGEYYSTKAFMYLNIYVYMYIYINMCVYWARLYSTSYSTKASMYVSVYIRIEGRKLTQQRLACICKYQSVCKGKHYSTKASMYLYTHIYVCIHNMCVYRARIYSTEASVHIYICVCVCIHMYIYVCVCVYTHTYAILMLYTRQHTATSRERVSRRDVTHIYAHTCSYTTHTRPHICTHMYLHYAHTPRVDVM